jgi:hypothetical protein
VRDQAGAVNPWRRTRERFARRHRKRGVCRGAGKGCGIGSTAATALGQPRQTAAGPSPSNNTLRCSQHRAQRSSWRALAQYPEHQFSGRRLNQLQAAVRDRVACSTGCGCHAGKTAPSPTLLALGRDEGLATTALRLTLGVETTENEIEEAASALVSAVKDTLAGANRTAEKFRSVEHRS